MTSSAPVGDGATRQTPPPKGRKVRLACQRCRDRRIKCDGQTPSCSKCAKAGVICIDVDTHRAGVSVPRAFLADAQARLEWLEEIVGARLPDVDLTAGPRILAERGESNNNHSEQVARDDAAPAESPAGTSLRTKRTSHEAFNDGHAAVSKRARRMAADLGLFSLNPNAAHPQYLGSSSGSFFADLLVEANHEYTSDPDADGSDDITHEPRAPHNGVRLLLESLKEALPPRDMCNKLVKAFFSFYHADYPVLHQPSLFNLADALYSAARAANDCALQHNGWPANVEVFRYNDEIAYVFGNQEAIPIHLTTGVTHLFFALSIGAELQIRKRRFVSDPKPFAAQAMASLQRSVAEVSLSSTQSMIVYILHSFLSADGARIWMILHIAMSYAIDLGLQRDRPATARSSDLVLQMRRRVFMTLYTLERYISTIQGRPLGFEDHTLDLAMPAFISEPFDNDRFRLDQLYLPYSLAHFKWAAMISESKQRFYRLCPSDESHSGIQAQQQQLQTRLEGWLEESLALVNNLPQAHQDSLKTKLKIDFQFAVGLLYQPSRSCPHPSNRALRLCFESAKQRIRLFDALYHQNDLALTWPKTHGVFLAAATFLYSICASAEIRSSISTAEVAGDMRLCSSLLALGGEWWPLAQRGKKSFERLADSTLNILISRDSNAGGEGQYLPVDFPSVPTEDSQLLDVETMFQPFFQDDLQFPDLFGMFDTTTFGMPEFSFPGASHGNTDYGQFG